MKIFTILLLYSLAGIGVFVVMGNATLGEAIRGIILIWAAGGLFYAFTMSRFAKDAEIGAAMRQRPHPEVPPEMKLEAYMQAVEIGQITGENVMTHEEAKRYFGVK